MQEFPRFNSFIAGRKLVIMDDLTVTAVEIFSKEPGWFIPHSTATVLVMVGSISH